MNDCMQTFGNDYSLRFFVLQFFPEKAQNLKKQSQHQNNFY